MIPLTLQFSTAAKRKLASIPIKHKTDFQIPATASISSFTQCCFLLLITGELLIVLEAIDDKM